MIGKESINIYLQEKRQLRNLKLSDLLLAVFKIGAIKIVKKQKKGHTIKTERKVSVFILKNITKNIFTNLEHLTPYNETHKANVTKPSTGM